MIDMWPFNNNIQISKSGIFKDITDYHSHLLPGVDDGVKIIDESLKILSSMEEAGFKILWLTPHIMEDYPNTTSDLKRRFEILKNTYQGTIELHLAAEYMLDNLFHERLAHNDLLTIGNEHNHVLVETSYFNPPVDLYPLLEAIKKKGYYPLLAHPERYRYMQWEDYCNLKKMGVKLQMNIPSLGGLYGKDVKEKAEKLLKNNFYDFAGNDIHSYRYFDSIMHAQINKRFIGKIPVLTASSN